MAEREHMLRRKEEEEEARLAKVGTRERVQEAHNRSAREMAEIEAIEHVRLTANDNTARESSPPGTPMTPSTPARLFRSESEREWYNAEQQRKRDEAAMESHWQSDDEDGDGDQPKLTAEQRYRMRLERQSVASEDGPARESRDDSDARYREEEEQRRRDEAAMEAAWHKDEHEEHEEHHDRAMCAMPGLQKQASVKGPSIALRYLQAVHVAKADPKHHHNAADD